MRADLHVHTCYSDGVETPTSILNRMDGRLSVISFCDHDTIAAYEHLPEEGSVRVLPGIEISTYHGSRSVHLLGYFPGGFDDVFRQHAKELEESRRRRVRAGVQSLRDQGVALRWEHLGRLVGPGVPCRSHVSRALIEMGYARNPRVIFERFLSGDRFEPPPWDIERSIELVRASGGIPVWAHPSVTAVDELAVRFRDMGLMGIEVHIPRRRRGDRRRMAEQVAELGLIATGGTDYHGPGGLLGNFTLDDELIPAEFRHALAL